MSEGANTNTATSAATGQGGEAAVASEAVAAKAAEGAASEASETAVNTETAEGEKKTETPEAKETKEDKKERELTAYMRNHYPDQDFDNTDSDAYDKLVLGRFGDLDKYQGDMKTANDSLVKILRSNDDVRKVLTDMIKGADFAEALVRHVDLDALKKAEGDPDYDKWSKNKNERLKSLSDQDERSKVIDTNREQSVKDMKAFFTENEISDDDATKFAGQIDAILQDVFDGKISKKFLSMMHKAVNYDTAVENAGAQGAIKAKNEKIETIKVEGNQVKGDGLPELASKNIETKEEKQIQLDPFSESLNRHLERNKAVDDLLKPGNTE